VNDADDPLALNDEIAALRHYVGEFTEREETPAALAALERIEARLHAALRTRAAILSDLGHELRNPLGAILGFCHLLRQDAHLSGDQRAHVEVIHRSGEELLALVDEFTGSGDDGAGPGFDLHYLLDDLADMLCLRAADAEVPLRIDRAPDLPRRVRADAVRLRHLLLLLLGNMLALPRREAVLVRVQLDRTPGLAKGALRLRIHAPGLDLGDLRLRSFVRTDAGLHTDDPARGPELAIALADQLGGELVFAPEELSLTIPVGLGRAEDPRRPARKIFGLVPGQEIRRILVAEDRWQGRQLLVQALRRVGFDVREAADGREALELWDTWRPHLVLMDMRMPTVSGIEATQQIRQRPGGETTVVIALTASAFEGDEATARAAGCDDFLRKPLQLHQVLDKVGERLGVAFLADDDAPAPGRVDAGALDGLPSPWLSALQQACVQADLGAILRMIDFIRGQAPQAAAVLTDMAEHYNYPAIIDLTRHALQAAGGGP
jgi:CheY-like chemotaxis protein